LTLLMEAIKGPVKTQFYWSMIFLVVLFAVALVVALFLKEPKLVGSESV